MRSVRVIAKRVSFLFLLTGVLSLSPRTATADLQGTEGLVRLSSPNVVGQGNWSAGLFGHYYRRMLPNTQSVKEHFAAGNLSGRFGLTKSLEAFAVLPGKGSLWEYKELPDRKESTEDHGGVSDARLGLKMRLPFESETYSFAIMADAAFPMGSGEKYAVPGEQHPRRLYSSGSTSLSARMCAGIDFSQVRALSPLKLVVNAGYWLSREEHTVRFPSYSLKVPGVLENKDVVTFGFALEFPSPEATLFTEFYTEQLINGSSVAASKENPILLTPGVKIKLATKSYRIKS